MPRKVIIDCDPGQDDALAIVLALAASDEIAVEAISTVSGNVPVDLTYRNAIWISRFCNAPDIPVYRGAARPLIADPKYAYEFHGDEGISGIPGPAPDIDETPVGASHGLSRILMDSDEKVTIVATGPLTNLAILLLEFPCVAEKIDEILIMGGAYAEHGNVSPAAEFNWFVDPHSVQHVLRAPVPKKIFSLDVTHQVCATRKTAQEFGALGNCAGELYRHSVEQLIGINEKFYGVHSTPCHDVMPIVYLLAPDLFDIESGSVAICTDLGPFQGAVALDRGGRRGGDLNADWVTNARSDRVFETILSRLR